jgi:hypothetical protein
MIKELLLLLLLLLLPRGIRTLLNIVPKQFATIRCERAPKIREKEGGHDPPAQVAQ